MVAAPNALWMMLFHAACSAIAGQMLPDSNRTRAITKQNDVAATIKSTAETTGDEPATYIPARMSGTCHRPQITSLARMGRGTPASMRRVSM